MIRVGIVGTGKTIGIAQFHYEGYKRTPEFALTAVYDIDRQNALDFCAKNSLPESLIVDSYASLLEQTDAVSICTPNDSHIDYAVQALQAGKHVLAEKPFGTSEAECQRAVDEAAKHPGLVNMTGLCYRGIPAVRLMKSMIEEGKLGEIYVMRQQQGGNRIAHPDVKLEWRMQKDQSGPGAIADFGSHMFDIADYLLREDCGEITSIQAMKQTYIKERRRIGSDVYGLVDNEDTAVFNAQTEKGTLLSFTASRIGCPYVVEIYGQGGQLTFNGNRPFEVIYHAKDLNGGYVQQPEVLEVPEALWDFGPATPKMPFIINFYWEVQTFLKAIQAQGAYEEAQSVDFARGAYIQRLIDTTAKAAASGLMETVRG